MDFLLFEEERKERRGQGCVGEIGGLVRAGSRVTQWQPGVTPRTLSLVLARDLLPLSFLVELLAVLSRGPLCMSWTGREQEVGHLGGVSIRVELLRELRCCFVPDIVGREKSRRCTLRAPVGALGWMSPVPSLYPPTRSIRLEKVW